MLCWNALKKVNTHISDERNIGKPTTVAKLCFSMAAQFLQPKFNVILGFTVYTTMIQYSCTASVTKSSRDMNNASGT